MPTPDPLRVSRRTAVAGSAAAAAAVVAGCTGDGTPAARRIPGRTVTPAPSPDVALAASLLTAEQRVLDLVEATARRHPAHAGALASARAAHRAHVSLLADAAPKGSPGPSPSTSPSAPVTAVPGSIAAALRAVATHESALAATERAGAEKARSGAFARVLASMAAAAEQQAVILGARARAGS